MKVHLVYLLTQWLFYLITAVVVFFAKGSSRKSSANNDGGESMAAYLDYFLSYWVFGVIVMAILTIILLVSALLDNKKKYRVPYKDIVQAFLGSFTIFVLAMIFFEML